MVPFSRQSTKPDTRITQLQEEPYVLHFYWDIDHPIVRRINFPKLGQKQCQTLLLTVNHHSSRMIDSVRIFFPARLHFCHCTLQTSSSTRTIQNDFRRLEALKICFLMGSIPTYMPPFCGYPSTEPYLSAELSFTGYPIPNLR